MHTKERIRQENWRQLVRLCVAVAALLVAYGGWFVTVSYKISLLLIYTAYLVLFIGISICAYRRRASPPPFEKVQIYCHVFIVILMSFFIFVSIQPFPDRPSVFFPLGYLLMNIIFFLPYRGLNIQMLLLESAFLLIAYMTKTPATFYFDITASLTACLFGCIASFLIQDLHIRETRMQYELEYVSDHDELTRLSNRRGFNMYMAHVYEECVREQSSCGILMMDIDYFKLYNDRYGHLAGDECLRRVSRALKEVSNQNGAFISRFGGEEFISVMHNADSKAVQAYAEELLDAVRSETISISNEIVTISIGVCVQIPQDIDGWVQQVDSADHALYISKKSGRNRISNWQDVEL